MFCKTCEYPLWNLTTRTCPECGNPFAPSEFDFQPESVRFCCPHCRQEYYGTGEAGHLVPRSFACVKCNAAIDMDEMVLIPREDVDEQRTKGDVVPWIERKRLGFFRGWFGTIGMAIGSPARLAKAIPDQGGAMPALWYCMLTQFVFGIVGMSMLLIFPLVLGAAMAGTGMGGGIVGLVISVSGMVLGTLIGVAVGVLIWSLVAHGLLLITGGARSGYGVTLSSICYAGGANFLSGLPCLGGYFSPFGALWWAIVGAVIVSVRQGVSGWRAALALVGPPAVLVLAGVALVIWWFTTFVGAMGGVMSGSSYAQGQSQTVQSALISYYATIGAYPVHAGELMGQAGGYVHPSDFRTDWSATSGGSDPFLGTVTLDDIYQLTGLEIDQLVQDEIAAMPANVIAHRVGDFVFTYHGLDPVQSDPGLWMFVAFGTSNAAFTTALPPPPGGTPTTPQPGLPTVIVATQLDGTPIELSPANWTQDLSDQNALRATEGLAPLPDLLLVTPDKPAAAGR